MANQRSEVNKSEEVRRLIKADPKVSAKEVIAALSERGITVTDSLYYFVKGKMKGRRSRREKAHRVVDKVATTTGKVDAVKTILNVKRWAAEVGGLKNLKALVDALCE
jgi:hypothetical protein